MWLTEKFNDFKDKNFCIWRDYFYSYNWLLAEINSMQSLIDQKLKDKFVVGIVSDYMPKTVALFLSCAKNKKIVVPISSTNESEIKSKVETAGVEAVLTFDEDENIIIKQSGLNSSNPLLEEFISNHRSGLILFSSGSTGEPKAMVHDLDSLMEMYRNKKVKDLKILIFLMFDHIGGLNTLLNSLSMGTTIVIPEYKDPEHIAALIEKHGVKLLPTSPTFLNLLLISGSHKKYDLSSLRIITYGTEPMPESLLKRLKSTFPKVKFLQTFGTSETGITTTFSKSSESLYMKIEDPNTQWKVVGTELWLKGKVQILGYLNYNNPFTEDGWFPTGDLVEVTEDGYIKIIGRKSEIINVGGQKVLPLEVESVLLEMEEIKDTIVYGESNPLMGEIVVAKVVLKTKLSLNEMIKKIKKHCRHKLGPYKVPIKIYVVDSVNYGKGFKKKRLIQEKGSL